MKYYISDLKVFDVEKMNKTILINYFKRVEDYSFIFSLDGIFKVNSTSKTIQKIIYKDNTIKSIKLDNYELLEDNSEYSYIDCFQIPYEHFSKKIREETYSMRENTPLKFIIIKDDTNNDIIDFYFYTNDSIYNPLIIKDIEAFLSCKDI